MILWILAYVLLGILVTAILVRRGILTVQKPSNYGIVALVWPLQFVLVAYLLFSAIVAYLAEG